MIYDIEIFGRVYCAFLVDKDGITFILSLGKKAVAGFKSGMDFARKHEIGSD